MFRSYCFCSYSNTAYKSPHFPFLTFPILLVPYFVPPSNLLGTFYIKVNRLENLYKIEHTPDYDVLTILNRKFVVGSLETKGSTASKTLTANGFSFKNSIVMATAKKDNCSVAVIHSGDNLDFSTLDATSGNVQNSICKVDFFILLKQ